MEESENSALPKQQLFEVERILHSPRPLEEIKKHLGNMMAGEDHNKPLIFLLLLSGKIPDPLMKQMVLLKGKAGVGKTTLMQIANLFKTKTIGRLSPTVLDYMDDLEDYDVLRLQELGQMDMDMPLKFLSADDKGYSIAVTVRTEDEPKPFESYERKIPPMTLITSTTRVQIEPQFDRRCWPIAPDESREQTVRIMKWKVRMEKEKDRNHLGISLDTGRERSIEVLKALVNTLQPCSVIIPFRRRLLETLPSEKLEVRGHYDKVLALLSIYGFLLQKQLPMLDGNPVLTSDRALEILEIAQESLTSMTTKDARIKEFIGALSEENLDKNDIIDHDARKRLARRMERTPRTVLTYLNTLEFEGFLRSHLEGRKKMFEVSSTIGKMKRRFDFIGQMLKYTVVLKSLMNREANKYLSNLCDQKEVGEEQKKELLKHFPI